MKFIFTDGLNKISSQEFKTSEATGYQFQINIDTNKRIYGINMRVDMTSNKIYALGLAMVDKYGIRHYIEHDLEEPWLKQRIND